MTIEDIRNFRYAEPFCPFQLTLKDGRKLLVRHPENIGWSPNGRKLAVYAVADAADLINLDNVIEVRPARGREKKRQNQLTLRKFE